MGRRSAHHLSLARRARSGVGLAALLGLLLALHRADQSDAQAVGVIHQPISFLETPTKALLSTIFLVVWKFAGFYMLILLVGLQSIPARPLRGERARRASRGQTFRYITLPLLRPSLALALILCVTGSLLAFDQFYILTKGRPDNATVTVVQLIYRDAFQRQNLGASAAISVVVLFALLALNAVQFRRFAGAERNDVSMSGLSAPRSTC